MGLASPQLAILFKLLEKASMPAELATFVSRMLEAADRTARVRSIGVSVVGGIKMRDGGTVWYVAGYVIKPVLESIQNRAMMHYSADQKFMQSMSRF